MDVLQIEKKGQLMNTWELFRINKLSKGNLQMNDTYTDIHNPIFNLINSHYNKEISTNLPPTHPTGPPLPHPPPPTTTINNGTYSKTSDSHSSDSLKCISAIYEGKRLTDTIHQRTSNKI
jgi:hypothetical protein